MNLVSATTSAATTSTAVIFSANCTATEQVDDLVYILSAGEVRQADASAAATARAVGFIKTKPSATTCEVQCGGAMGGLSGLTAGSTYFVSETPGAVATAPGTIMVVVGEALSATQIVLRLEDAEQIS
jgi:hypothetical protein